jgi:hypothetical protein
MLSCSGYYNAELAGSHSLACWQRRSKVASTQTSLLLRRHLSSLMRGHCCTARDGEFWVVHLVADVRAKNAGCTKVPQQGKVTVRLGLLFLIYCLLEAQGCFGLNDAPAAKTYIALDALAKVRERTVAAEEEATNPMNTISQEAVSSLDEYPLLIPAIFKLSPNATISSVVDNGTFFDTLRILRTSDERVIPFSSKVEHDGGVASLVASVTNESLSKDVGTLSTVGTVVESVALRSGTLNLRISSLSTTCSSALLLDADTEEVLKAYYYQYVRSPPGSGLIRMPFVEKSNASVGCSTSTGRVFADHGDGSQRFWRRASANEAVTSIGNFSEDDLSQNNDVILFSKEERARLHRQLDSSIGSSTGQAVLRHLEDLASRYEGVGQKLLLICC